MDSKQVKTKITSAFKNYIFDGILLVLCGIAMLIWPGKVLEFFFLVAGIVLILLGVWKVITFIRAFKSELLLFSLMIGILEIVLGIFFIVKPGIFLQFLNIILGVMILFGALLMIIHIIKENKKNGFMFVLSLILAILMLCLGAVVLINPVGFAAFMVQLYGISLIVEGISFILFLR